ncbi:D-hexose-6-phosphate mutarotase [Actinomycetaceae bacterium L2_0104]
MNTIDAPDVYAGPAGKAAIYPYSANLTLWQPPNSRSVIWVSEHSLYREGTAIRGGVPICFPWFAKGLSGQQLPSHGLARLSTFQRVDVREDDDAVVAIYELDSPDAYEAERFPHPYAVRYTIRMGAPLELTYAVTNTGDDDLTFEEALHSYLAVSDICDVTVEGLAGCGYRDNTTGESHVQEGDIRFSGEVDRIYSTTGDIRVVDPGWNRTLRITRTNSASAIVWNPWSERASELPDFGDDEWRGMVCIEGANVREEHITIAPGETHTMGYAIEVIEQP